ncbi:hypothetical protein C8Q74DRAFT_1233667 [Fomes fomentarius]|nr:hypothetical protein C8Q74DRAFT_1233667 [Fomes fomentarius]
MSSAGVSGAESESEVSALLTPVENDDDEDDSAEIDVDKLYPGRCARAFGWNIQDSEHHDDVGGIGELSGSSFLYGQPLCVIPEETRSEIGSIMNGVTSSALAPGAAGGIEKAKEEAEDSRVVSMELDSGIVECEIVTGGEKSQSEEGLNSAQSRLSGVWDQSWREGDTRNSVGVAW